jgi:hypothetical protein
MTDEMMTLRSMLEKGTDADVLREMIGYAAQRLMEMEGSGGDRRRPWRAMPRPTGSAQWLPRPDWHGQSYTTSGDMIFLTCRERTTRKLSLICA